MLIDYDYAQTNRTLHKLIFQIFVNPKNQWKPWKILENHKKNIKNLENQKKYHIKPPKTTPKETKNHKKTLDNHQKHVKR